jgi:hypothetical protein
MGTSMARIYSKALNHFSGLNSVALDANGDLAAVCLNDSELFVYRIIEGAQPIDPAQTINPRDGPLEEGASLEEHRFLRLLPDRYKRAPAGEVHFRDTKLTFLNEESLLVAREIQRTGGADPAPPAEQDHISLAAIKVDTGDMVAEFTDPAYGPILDAPLFIPPRYVLFPAGQTVICIDAVSVREVFRCRKFDESGAVVDEEGSSGGEQVAGIAYHSSTGILYVLWREFVSSFLQAYRLHPHNGTFERLQRRLVLEGFEGGGLCVRPDGKEVAVWFTTMDEVIDCRTEKGLKIPETARLGRLGIFPPASASRPARAHAARRKTRSARPDKEGGRFFDVHSKIELHPWLKCDFALGPAYSTDRHGNTTEIGIRYGVGPYLSRPFYLDDHTVVINTPGGLLIGVDTVSGQTQVLLQEFSPIEDLCVNLRKHLLLVGTKAGSLHLLGLA